LHKGKFWLRLKDNIIGKINKFFLPAKILMLNRFATTLLA